MSIQELEAEALKFPPEDQARLLHQLALSLDREDASALTNADLEKRWTEFQESAGAGIDSKELRLRAQRRHGIS